MSVFTSTHFASVCVDGTDWRDTSKKLLEQLDSIRTEDDGFTLGFLYVSDRLADDIGSILTLCKSVTNIETWVGAVGLGVIGSDKTHFDTPALSAMLCRIPEDDFCVFPVPSDETEEDKDAAAENAENVSQEKVKDWILENGPIFGVTHADPVTSKDPQTTLRELEAVTQAFIVGGLSASRNTSHHIAFNPLQGGLSGVFFSPSQTVSTMLSQGCAPVSQMHTITKTDDNAILELNDTRAADVLQQDLRKHAADKSGTDIEMFDKALQDIESSAQIPQEFLPLFHRKIHVGLPIILSDQKDYIVRDIIGIDADEGSISISDRPEVGRHIVFMERSTDTIASDLSKNLVAFRRRVTAERGSFEPKGALYISCVARAEPDKAEGIDAEIKLIRDIIGPVPLTGFYAGGEISNGRIYGYTGVLSVFF